MAEDSGKKDLTEDQNTDSEQAESGSDSPPDRLSTDPTSKHYSEADLERGVGIKFRGKERTNILEYSISEGWVKMVMGKTVDRYGKPLTVKSKGPVEAWYRDDNDDAAEGGSEDSSEGKDDA